jgi:AcrR family transcriptional regulator
MYAERGVNGVSLREIGAAAGQLNTGAARYHFGSKVGLINAVFEHRMVPINERRTVMLDAIVADGASADLRRLAEAFIVPLATALGDRAHPSCYLRFAVQAGHLEGSAPTRLTEQAWTSGMDRLHTMALAALAEVPEPLREQRWWLFNSYAAHALADRERLLEHPVPAGWLRRDVFLSTVTDTAVALLCAPVSATTTNLLEGATR